jgi:hypothetical protein
MPVMTSNQFQRYCETVQAQLWDETRLISAINQSCQTLDTVLGSDYDRDKAKDSTIQDRARAIIQSQ